MIVIRPDPGFGERKAGDEPFVKISARLDQYLVERRGPRSQLLQIAREVADYAAGVELV